MNGPQAPPRFAVPRSSLQFPCSSLQSKPCIPKHGRRRVAHHQIGCRTPAAVKRWTHLTSLVRRAGGQCCCWPRRDARQWPGGRARQPSWPAAMAAAANCVGEKGIFYRPGRYRRAGVGGAELRSTDRRTGWCVRPVPAAAWVWLCACVPQFGHAGRAVVEGLLPGANGAAAVVSAPIDPRSLRLL